MSDGPRKIYGKYNEAAPGGEVIKRSELEDVFIDKTEDSKGWNGDGVGRGLFNEERGYRSDYGTLENSVNDDDTLVCQSLAEDILGCPGEMESEPEEMEEMEFGRRFRGVATNSEMGQDSTANINPDDQVDNSVEAVDLANATHEEIMDFIQQLQHQVRHKDMQIKKLEEANHYMNAEKDLFKAEMERIRGMNVGSLYTST